MQVFRFYEGSHRNVLTWTVLGFDFAQFQDPAGFALKVLISIFGFGV